MAEGAAELVAFHQRVVVFNHVQNFSRTKVPALHAFLFLGWFGVVGNPDFREAIAESVARQAQ